MATGELGEVGLLLLLSLCELPIVGRHCFPLATTLAASSVPVSVPIRACRAFDWCVSRSKQDCRAERIESAVLDGGLVQLVEFPMARSGLWLAAAPGCACKSWGAGSWWWGSRALASEMRDMLPKRSLA